MRGRAAWGWLAPLLVASLATAGADLVSLERGLRDAIAERDLATEERSRRMSEARGLADDIARLKAAHTDLRADPGLEAALKRFDRIAADLDALDRTMRDRDRRAAALRRRFEEEASTEAARLSSRPSGSIADVARQLAAIDEARRRVARLSAGGPALRPPLDIELLPTDGSLEIDQKVELAEAERDRLTGEQVRLDTAAAVVGVRLLIKQQLVSELESAARAGGSELALLTRESQNAVQAVQDLRREQEQVWRQKASVAESLAALERHLGEFRRRLRALKGEGGRP